jgi:hypothetical protein
MVIEREGWTMTAEPTKTEGLALHMRWAELFDHLSAADRYSMIQAVAAGWHEGWTPDREDVQCLVEFHCGEIDFDEYCNRALAKR